jgi:hypothetical protein
LHPLPIWVIIFESGYEVSDDNKTKKLKPYVFGTYEVTSFEMVLKSYSTSLDALEVYAFIPMSMNGGSNPMGDNSGGTRANDN